MSSKLSAPGEALFTIHRKIRMEMRSMHIYIYILEARVNSIRKSIDAHLGKITGLTRINYTVRNCNVERFNQSCYRHSMYRWNIVRRDSLRWNRIIRQSSYLGEKLIRRKIQGTRLFFIKPGRNNLISIHTHTRRVQVEKIIFYTPWARGRNFYGRIKKISCAFDEKKNPRCEYMIFLPVV